MAGGGTARALGRVMTPSEKAAFIRHADESSTEWRRRDAVIRRQAIEAVSAIALLERRVREEPAPDYITLRGGDRIAVRSCMSETEERLAGQLLLEWVSRRRPEAAFELVELITVDEELNKEWMLANPDKFAANDFLEVLLQYFESQEGSVRQRAERVIRAISFRLDPRGEGIRPDAQGPRGAGPANMGGPP